MSLAPAALLFSIRTPVRADGTSGATQPAPATAPADPSQSTLRAQNADRMRVAADAKWGHDHDFKAACRAYDVAREKYPTDVRLLISMASVSIDFASQHASTNEGDDAYARAKAGILKAQKILDDGDGQNIDPSAKETLQNLLRLIP
jgi:hypothetical protein